MIRSKLAVIEFVVYLRHGYELARDITEPMFLQKFSYAFIYLGVTMFALCFLGYIASVKESTTLVYIFALLVLMIFVSQVLSTVLMLALEDKPSIGIEDLLKASIEDYRSGIVNVKDPHVNTAGIHKVWDELNSEYQCCGVDGHGDFKDLSDNNLEPIWKLVNQTWIPRSCCKSGHSCISEFNVYNSNMHTGCKMIINYILSTNKLLMLLIGIGLSLAEIIALVITSFIFFKHHTGLLMFNSDGFINKKFPFVSSIIKEDAGRVVRDYPRSEGGADTDSPFCKDVCFTSSDKSVKVVKIACPPCEPKSPCPPCPPKDERCQIIEVPCVSSEPKKQEKRVQIVEVPCQQSETKSILKPNTTTVEIHMPPAQQIINNSGDEHEDRSRPQSRASSKTSQVHKHQPSCHNMELQSYCKPVATCSSKKIDCCSTQVCQEKPDFCPPLMMASMADQCCLETRLRYREMRIMFEHERMLLEQKLHHREQMIWDHEQFRRQQLVKRERQIRYKADQMNTEQEMHMRDNRIRMDREDMLTERDMFQQDQIAARARQELFLQREVIFQKADEASKRRMISQDACFNKPLTCDMGLKLALPEFEYKDCYSALRSEDGDYFDKIKGDEKKKEEEHNAKSIAIKKCKQMEEMKKICEENALLKYQQQMQKKQCSAICNKPRHECSVVYKKRNRSGNSSNNSFDCQNTCPDSCGSCIHHKTKVGKKRPHWHTHCNQQQRKCKHCHKKRGSRFRLISKSSEPSSSRCNCNLRSGGHPKKQVWVTSDPSQCRCRCHYNSLQPSKNSFCEFCDCATLEEGESHDDCRLRSTGGPSSTYTDIPDHAEHITQSFEENSDANLRKELAKFSGVLLSGNESSPTRAAYTSSFGPRCTSRLQSSSHRSPRRHTRSKSPKYNRKSINANLLTKPLSSLERRETNSNVEFITRQELDDLRNAIDRSSKILGKRKRGGRVLGGCDDEQRRQNYGNDDGVTLDVNDDFNCKNEMNNSRFADVQSATEEQIRNIIYSNYNSQVLGNSDTIKGNEQNVIEYRRDFKNK